jgi:hypothetical protein
MTIAIEKDIDIRYVDGAAQVGQQLLKNNLVYLDDLARTTKDQPFCVYISDQRTLEGYAGTGTNPKVFAFLNMFLQQPQRPPGFWYCAAPAAGSSGYLQTGELDTEQTFFAKFRDPDNPDIFLPIAFKTSTGSASTNNPFIISGDDLYEMDGYAELVISLSAQNTGNIKITKSGNTINFSTIAIGPTEGVIDYLTADNSPIAQGAKLLTGALSTWDDFKSSFHDLDALNLTLKNQDGDADVFKYENVAYKELTSWTDFAESLNSISQETVKVRYLSTNKLLFRTMAVGPAATMGDAESEDNPNTAAGLHATIETGATLIQGENKIPTVDAASALKGSSTSPGVEKVAGEGDIHSSPQYMQSFMMQLSKASVNPNCVCLSRYLTLGENNSTDVDTTKSLISGFSTYFSPNSSPTTASLWISTNIYENVEGINIWQDIIGGPNSRNIVLVYQSNQEEYAEGAVATWGAAIDWEGSNVVRNSKGLDLMGVNPDPAIDNDLNDKLTKYSINFYGRMTNGMSMFREGITCYSGEMGNIYIDTMLGINAIQIDMKNKLIRALKQGTTRLNSEGISKIYDVLANVCEKYVVNGFLAPGSYTKVIDGEMKTIIINPYRIEISRIITDQQINSRVFPETWVYLASSIFANKFKISLTDAYLALGD